MGLPLEEICYQEEDRLRLRNHKIGKSPLHSTTTPSTAATLGKSNGKKSPDPLGSIAGAWERQEALGQKMADPVNLDVTWASSPTGFSRAELFIAGTATSTASLSQGKNSGGPKTGGQTSGSGGDGG